MYLRKHYRRYKGERKAYWALVESYRVAGKPRQRVVAHLGEMDAAGRRGLLQAISGQAIAQEPFWEEESPRWVEVDVQRVRVEHCRAFGGPWLGWQLAQALGWPQHWATLLDSGREEVAWPLVALVLVLGRFCHPSSELQLAEQCWTQSALPELLGIHVEKLNPDRLYRGLDQLLPHKVALECQLRERLGELFGLEYDLLLYDITSTFFEGQAPHNPLAQRGYSRDNRGDCKQVCIGLVVTKSGFPLGYEVWPGNRADVTTLQEMVTSMEARYGRAQRIWVADRGMVSEANLDFLRAGERSYIVGGKGKAQLQEYAGEFRSGGWEEVHPGLEVKVCASRVSGERIVLCRSQARKEKDRAIITRLRKKVETGLTRLAERCRKQRCRRETIERAVGSLLGQCPRVASHYQVEVSSDAQGRTTLEWQYQEERVRWAEESQGCYFLRTNIEQWSGEELWSAYMQLVEAEAAFRVQKSDLGLRPIWHQKAERVKAHILVCFLAYVLWKTLAGWCQQAGLGDEPRQVLEELSELRVLDVVLPTREGVEVRRRCVTRPTRHQAILLDRLGLSLPEHLKIQDV